jgi:putative FmdB family regulatory protein
VPTYEFRCRTCDTIFEERRTMATATDPAMCPDGHKDTVKLLSIFAAARSGAGRMPAAMPSGGGGGGCCGGGCGCH